MNTQKLAGRYNYYAENIARFMTDSGLIAEEESPEIEIFIRGCA